MEINESMIFAYLGVGICSIVCGLLMIESAAPFAITMGVIGAVLTSMGLLWSSFVIFKIFDKDKFMIKITPIHNNNACRENGIETKGVTNS